MKNDAALNVATQIERLVSLGYPGLAGLTDTAFRALLAPLATAYGAQCGAVLVITRELIDPETRVGLLQLAGGSRPGAVDRHHDDLATFHPLAVLNVPAGPAYLLVDVERGEEFCGVPPEDALPAILSRGRTPLTIDEGIAVVTHRPELLAKNKCFMLSGFSARRPPGAGAMDPRSVNHPVPCHVGLVLGWQPARMARSRVRSEAGGLAANVAVRISRLRSLAA
ncbi:MAG: DUF5701 family protein [Nocardioides sp.]